MRSSITAKRIGSHWFKNVLLDFFSHKMMKFYIDIFSAWTSSTSAKHFLSQKNKRNVFDLLKFTSMDFFWLFGILQESHWFYTSIFKKLHIIYQYCYQLLMLLLGRILPGAIISHDLKIQSLGFEKDLNILMFTVWESLFSNHKSESSIPWHIFILYIFQIFCCLKNYKMLFSQKCFTFVRYITNI